MNINQETGRPELDEYEQKRHDEFLHGLRGLLAFYEARQDMPAPHVNTEMFFVVDNKEELAAFVREIGSLEKMEWVADDSYELRKTFSATVMVRLIVDKGGTCERVKVGEEVIPAKPERILAAEPERVVPKYEWKCPKSILAMVRPEPRMGVEVRG